MTEKQGPGAFEAMCDVCPEHVEIEAASFKDAADRLKRDGWRIDNVKGEWLHTCPSCLEDASSPDAVFK